MRHAVETGAHSCIGPEDSRVLFGRAVALWGRWQALTEARRREFLFAHNEQEGEEGDAGEEERIVAVAVGSTVAGGEGTGGEVEDGEGRGGAVAMETTSQDTPEEEACTKEKSVHARTDARSGAAPLHTGWDTSSASRVPTGFRCSFFREGEG